MSNKIYIDRFDHVYPYGNWGLEFETKEDFKRYSLQHFRLSKEYTYTEETFPYNGVDYYLWVASDVEADESKYILTTTLDFDGETLEDDIQNDVCPYKFVLNEDKELSYTDSNRDKYTLVKQIISDGCCASENCQSLITVEYLNQLGEEGCVHVTGTPLTGCCEFEDSADGFSPAFGNFAMKVFPMRETPDEDDPSEDKNGFIYTPKQEQDAGDNCCLSGLAPISKAYSKIPRKDEVSFGYTEPTEYSPIILKQPSCDDPSFEYVGKRRFVRHTVQCDGEGIIDSGDNVSGSNYTVIGQFTKSCNIDGNTITIGFGSPSYEISGASQSCRVTSNNDEVHITGACEMTNALESGCTEEIISSTTISAPASYSLSISVSKPETIPCNGATVTCTVNGETCNDEIVITPNGGEMVIEGGKSGNFVSGFTISVNNGMCSTPIVVNIPYESCGIRELNGTACLDTSMRFYLGEIVDCDVKGKSYSIDQNPK